MAKRHFEAAVLRLRVRDAKLTHASIQDMLQKTIAREKEEKEREEREEAERRKSEKEEETKKREGSNEQIRKKIKAQRAAKAEEEKAEPLDTSGVSDGIADSIREAEAVEAYGKGDPAAGDDADVKTRRDGE